MEESIIGIVFIGLGLLFFFNNKNLGDGLAKFYRKLYTERNSKVMFRACGVILILGGVALIFLK